jgi:Fic family protein
MLLTAQAIKDPFEQAFFLLVHIPYLQPFSDVNKRTSRLAANLPLLQANLQPLSFMDVSSDAYTLATLAVYEVRKIDGLRDVFLWAYRRSAERYQADQARFQAVALQELRNLNEGTFARYGLRPSEFDRWLEGPGIE